MLDGRELRLVVLRERRRRHQGQHNSLYEMILTENDALSPDQEIGRRYIPGELPLQGEKRPV